MNKPFISICIPAYKQAEFLRRLLVSIQNQQFKNFEVIVTDDTPDDSVEKVCRDFISSLPLSYQYNKIPLGSPENWNAAVRKARAEWIKIMHGDDWFTVPESLEKFAQAARDQRAGFIFSSYFNYREDTGTQQQVGFSAAEQSLLRRSPFNLLKRNFVGPPSTTLVHKSIAKPYHPALKWIVDFEGYIRMLKLTGGEFNYIPEPLICVGVHPEQVTASCFLNPEVEIPENNLLANTYDPELFQNFFGFDYFWRLIRNLEIKTVAQFQSYIPGEPMNPILVNLIRQANAIPLPMRRIGVISKVFSFYYWVRNKHLFTRRSMELTSRVS